MILLNKYFYMLSYLIVNCQIKLKYAIIGRNVTITRQTEDKLTYNMITVKGLIIRDYKREPVDNGKINLTSVLILLSLNTNTSIVVRFNGGTPIIYFIVK